MRLLRILIILAAFLLAGPAFAADGMLPRISFLVYHSIFPDHDGQTEEQRAYTVPPAQLDEQLAFLAENGYVTITAAQAVDALREGTTTQKLVAITFDDGWWNQYAYAVPLLKKYGMTATFFIYPAPIGKSSLFMDWDQVRAIATAGMSIESHSLTHPLFPGLPADRIASEIADSKRVIEAEIERPVTVFATPYGYTSPSVDALLMQNGYVADRTLGGGVPASSTGLYRLPGVVVTRDMARFERTVLGAP